MLTNEATVSVGGSILGQSAWLWIIWIAGLTVLGARDPAICRRGMAHASRSGIKWTRDLVLAKIKQVASAKRPKIPMNSTSFGKQNSRAIKAITGFSGAYLMELALRHVDKDWDGVLRALDLDVLETRKAIKLSPELFAKAVVALHDAGVEVNAAALQDDQSDRSREIVKAAIGSGITGAQVYWAGFARYGRDWRKALSATTLDPELIARRHQWTREQLIAIAKKLATEKVELHVLALYGEEFGDALWRHTGIKAKGCSIYRAARSRFGSWDNLLRAAELDPGTIRRHFWRRGNLSIVPHQTEMSKTSDGNVRFARLIGKRVTPPDEQAENNELVARLHRFITTSHPEDRDLAMRVVDYVLATNGKTDATTIARELEEPDDVRVKLILARLRNSGVLPSAD